MDALSKQTLSIEDQKAIVTLSYEKYLADSIDAFKIISKEDYGIIKSSDDFEHTVELLKRDYKSMSKESAEAEATKMKFGEKVKELFSKIWIAIATIFSKLSEIVVQLVKSLVIYIQKKRIQATSIINLLKDKGENGFTPEGKSILEVVKEKNYSIKTLMYKEIDKKSFGFKGIHMMLNSTALQKFVKSAVILKNKDSIFNTESLTKYLNDDLIKGDTDDKKMTELEMAVNNLYAQGVFYGEVDPKHLKENSLMEPYKAYLESHEIAKVAHMMTMGMETPKFMSIPLSDFFGESIDSLTFKQAWQMYIADTKLVLDNGGYISTLEEVLKRYKDIAVNDAKNINMLKDFIIKKINEINTKGDKTEEDHKVEHKLRRFTSLMLGVKNIKNHFIRLRQTMILDIITLYSIENRAWFLATDKEDLIKKELGKDHNDDTLFLGSSTDSKLNAEIEKMKKEGKTAQEINDFIINSTGKNPDEVKFQSENEIKYRQGDESLKNK